MTNKVRGDVFASVVKMQNQMFANKVGVARKNGYVLSVEDIQILYYAWTCEGYFDVTTEIKNLNCQIARTISSIMELVRIKLLEFDRDDCSKVRLSNAGKRLMQGFYQAMS